MDDKNRMDEVFADPQVKHLAMTEPVEHPALGRLDIPRNAVRSFTSVAALVGLVGPAWAAEILFTARRQKPSRWDWSTASCRPRICAMR